MRKKIEVDLVGFDLDKTLYEPNPAIDEKIQDYACRKASEILNKDYSFIRKEFDRLFLETQSGKDSLTILGLKNGSDIMQEALEYSDISSILEEDKELNRMMKNLKKVYGLFLITGSAKRIALKKLEALGIDSKIFHPTLYSESKYKRKDGSAFNYVSNLCNVPFEKMMFVGDREQADIIPAKKLGIKTAIVNSVSKEADYQLKSIYDLDKILLE